MRTIVSRDDVSVADVLAARRRGEDPEGLVERSIGLTARALERGEPGRVAAGRLATAPARRA